MMDPPLRCFCGKQAVYEIIASDVPNETYPAGRCFEHANSTPAKICELSALHRKRIVYNISLERRSDMQYGIKNKSSSLWFGGFDASRDVIWVSEADAKTMDKQFALAQASLLSSQGQPVQNKPVKLT
jgi:hypothetical protein